MKPPIDVTGTGFDTRAIHAGRTGDESAPAIHMAATAKTFYTRGSSNPTIRELEAAVAAIEGGSFAISTACGMAAVSQTLLGLASQGDRILCHRSVYDWSDWLIRDELPRFGVRTEQLDFRDLAALDRALATPARLVYFEPLSNPGLDLLDVAAIVARAHAAGALVVVDNTFLSPALFRPLEHGADVVMHSATKYLSGHGDALAGVIVTGRKEIHERLYQVRNLYGGILSPFNAFLVMRGISTLPMRMRQHSANAKTVAEFLSGHLAVASVRSPALPGDPGHALARKMLPAGCGGMIGFVLKGGEAVREAFKSRLKLCRPWVSLGDTGTLVYARKEEERKGIPGGYVRLSVGLEDVNDIIADLDQSLKQTVAGEPAGCARDAGAAM